MRRLFAGLVLALAAAAAQGAGHTEAVMKATIASFLERESIVVTVHKPEGSGPFPLLVLSHGSPRSADDRLTFGRARLVGQSRPFVEMGFAVLVPTRRGYGESGGRWAEGYGSCFDPDYYAAGLETARDLRAAVDAVRAEPWADTSRIVLAGQSAGGFGSVAAASGEFKGVRAVINFAGGRGSQGPDNVCHDARLVDAMERYGKSVRVPTLWLYSENDRFFGPRLAQRMHAAFVKSGGKAEFVQVPPTGLDGHGYFMRAIQDWSPRVAAFLRREGAL
jgi:dienelactone hydrolase